MYKCPDCEKTFSTKGILKTHMNKKYKCKENKDDSKLNTDKNELMGELFDKLKNELKEYMRELLMEKNTDPNNSTNNSNNSQINNIVKDSEIHSDTNSHNNINVNSNNSNSNSNVSFNLQYIEKNFTNAKNIEDEIKIEKVTDDIYKECKGKRIKNGSTHLFQKLCIDNKKAEERSIHCLDASRNNYAVKTNDNWKKDNNGTIIKEKCLPVIQTIYKKIMTDLFKENELSGGMLSEISIEVLKYDNNSFNKTLNDCNSLLILKNSNKNKEIEDKKENMENKQKNEINEIKGDIYKIFLEKKTRKSINNIHTQFLYEKFIEWYKENIGENNIPSNRDFIKNLRIHFLIHKSIKIGDKVSTGIKNLEFF
jgi:hypothetical protein